MLAQDAYLKYRKEALPPAVLRDLSRPRPLRLVVDTVSAWAGIVAAWVAVAYVPTWWMVLVAIPVIGTRYYALAIQGHDGLHRRLLPTVRANDWFNDVLLIGPIGGITRLHNHNHLDHHQHLAQPTDPDRHKYQCLDKGTWAHLAGYLIGVRGVSRSVTAVLQPGPPPVAGRRRPRASWRDLIIITGWQAALIGGLSLGIGWWAYPVLWVVPVLAFTVVADQWRTFCEHSQPERDTLADSHRLITYVSSPLERAVLAPRGMNFHAAHHLWPSIPYYNLAAADALLRRSPHAAALEWRTSYLGYLWRYYRALPIEGCRADVG